MPHCGLSVFLMIAVSARCSSLPSRVCRRTLTKGSDRPLESAESRLVPEIMCSSNVPITSRPPYTLSRSGSLIRRTADEWGFV